MGLAGKVWFRVTNDLLHDIAAAWPGFVLGLWFVRSGARTTLGVTAFDALMRTWSPVVLLILLAIVVQVITGTIRLNYWRLTIRPEAVKSRGRAAQVKHAFFTLAVILAIVAMFLILQP